MHDQRTTQNTVAASVQCEVLDHKIDSSNALCICIQTGQITQVMGLAVTKLAMRLLCRVEVAASAQAVAAGAIAFFMDVKTVLRVRRQPFHTPLHANTAFSRAAAKALMQLSGDQGASAIVRKAAENQQLKRWVCDDIGCVLDVDTVPALEQARKIWQERQ